MWSSFKGKPWTESVREENVENFLVHTLVEKSKTILAGNI
jgi:hypothetical protein